jgi:hypothetical protein
MGQDSVAGVPYAYMTEEKRNHSQNIIDKLIDTLMQQPWSAIVIDLWKIGRELIQRHFPKGPYEVIEYESTLELTAPNGEYVAFKKCEKVRCLQDNYSELYLITSECQCKTVLTA